MRLTSEVALVGGGMFGFDLTSALDCHVYLLDGGDELALIDAGVGDNAGDTNLLIESIKSDGFDTSKITRLLLTHYHADHAGGAAELRDALGLTIHGSPLTASTLEAGDEEQISLPFGKRAGFYPRDYTFRPAPTTGDLVEGHTFNVGNLGVTVYETPGHSDGHVSFLVQGAQKRYLIEGDVVFHGGLILLQNIPDCSIEKYAASVEKLAGLEFDALLPGHLTISMNNGKRHVDAANAQFGNLAVPKNLL